ncbi:MAG TPA: outer membrane beta-barrel protein [Burkholderiales bacterium]|jgi:OOP family OmpA-OmpF porin|nr:outer membrane beta-barrel protein [Burkholderiales bacterium]
MLNSVIRRALPLLVATGLAFPQWAGAQSAGSGYIGASVGASMASDFCDDEPGVTLIDCEDQDAGFKLFAGYQFNANFAAEAAYVNLGEISGRGSFLGTPFDLKFQASAMTVQGVGILPFREGALFGKAGLSFWNLDTRGIVAGAPGSASDDGVDVTIGLGAQFAIGGNLGIRAEWDFFPDFGDDDTGEEDIHLFSVGIVVWFR